MKFLIVCALFSVAFAAEVNVVHLPAARAPAFHQVDMRPLIIPQAVINAMKFAEVAINRDAEIDDSLKVKVVDAPVATAEQDFTVRVVDAPEIPAVQLDAVKVAPVEIPAAVQLVDAVKVAPVEIPAAVQVVDAVKVAPVEIPATVQIVDAVKVAPVEIPAAVQIVDAVKVAPVELPAAVQVVDAVKVASVEIPAAVQFVDAVNAPVDETVVADDSMMVRVVDAPVQAKIDAVRIAEPALPVVEAPLVDAVRVASINDALNYPKIYADPRLRSPYWR